MGCICLGFWTWPLALVSPGPLWWQLHRDEPVLPRPAIEEDLEAQGKVKAVVAMSVGSCHDPYSTMGHVGNLHPDLGMRGGGLGGEKIESQDVGVDLEREALRGVLGMPPGDWVTPERLVKEVTLCTSVYSPQWATNSLEGRGCVREVTEPGGHRALCPHSGSSSAGTCTLSVLPSAGLASPQAGPEMFSENEPGSATSHNRP